MTTFLIFVALALLAIAFITYKALNHNKDRNVVVTTPAPAPEVTVPEARFPIEVGDVAIEYHGVPNLDHVVLEPVSETIEIQQTSVAVEAVDEEVAPAKATKPRKPRAPRKPKAS